VAEDGLIYSFSTTDLELVQVPNQWPNVRWKKARLTKDLSAALVNVARSTDIEDLGKLWVLDLRTCGKSLHVPEWSLHAIGLAMSSNGKHIAYIERIEGAGIPHSEDVFLLSSPTDPPVCLSTTTNLRYYCIQMSADGSTVAWGSVSGSIYVWQAATNVRIASPTDNEQWHPWTGGTTSALAMAPDGRTVLAVGFSGMVLWDIERWCLRNSIAYDERLHAAHVAALTPDQRFAITGHGHGSHAVRLWDLQSGTCIATFTGESEITALATDGDVIVVGEAAGNVHALRIADATQSGL